MKELIQSSDSLKFLELTDNAEMDDDVTVSVDMGFLCQIIVSYGRSKSKQCKYLLLIDINTKFSMKDAFEAITEHDQANIIVTTPCYHTIHNVDFEFCSSTLIGFTFKLFTEKAIRVNNIDCFFNDLIPHGSEVEMALGISRFFRSLWCSVETLTINGDFNDIETTLRVLIDGAGSCRSLRCLMFRLSLQSEGVNVNLVCEVLHYYRDLKELILIDVIRRDEDWSNLCNGVCSVHSLQALSIGSHLPYRAGNGFGSNFRNLVTTSGLKKLTIENVDMSSVADIEENFAANKSLRDFDFIPVNEAQARAVFRGLQTNSFLQGLTLSRLSFEAPTTNALLECLRNGNIKRLEICGYSLGAGSRGCNFLRLVSIYFLQIKSTESLIFRGFDFRDIENSITEIAAAMKQNWTLRRFHISHYFSSNDVFSDDARKKLGDLERYTVRNRFHKLVQEDEPLDILRLAPLLFEKVSQSPSNVFVGLQTVVNLLPFEFVSNMGESSLR